MPAADSVGSSPSLRRPRRSNSECRALSLHLEASRSLQPLQQQRWQHRGLATQRTSRHVSPSISQNQRPAYRSASRTAPGTSLPKFDLRFVSAHRAPFLFLQNCSSHEFGPYRARSSQLHQRVSALVLPFARRAVLTVPCSSRPENNTRPYTIGTTFPNRTLDNDSVTIEAAGLLNSVIVQRWA